MEIVKENRQDERSFNTKTDSKPLHVCVLAALSLCALDNVPFQY